MGTYEVEIEGFEVEEVEVECDYYGEVEADDQEGAEEQARAAFEQRNGWDAEITDITVTLIDTEDE